MTAACGAVLLAGCGGGSDAGKVSRSSFASEGKTWPLTVESGSLACHDGNSITFTSGGTTYAANGTAKGSHRWPDIDPSGPRRPVVSA